MKQIFKKKFSVKNNVSERLSVVATVSNRMFVLLAQYLNRRTIQCRPGVIAFTLLALCLIGAIIFSLLGLYAFKADSLLQIQSVRIPSISKLSSPFPVFDYTIERIHRFHHYMDSLRSSDSVRYNSIIQARPQLMDSVAIVEKLIHQ